MSTTSVACSSNLMVDLDALLQVPLGEPIPVHLTGFSEEHQHYLKLAAWTTQGLIELFLSIFAELQQVSKVKQSLDTACMCPTRLHHVVRLVIETLA